MRYTFRVKLGFINLYQQKVNKRQLLTNYYESGDKEGFVTFVI